MGAFTAANRYLSTLAERAAQRASTNAAPPTTPRAVGLRANRFVVIVGGMQRGALRVQWGTGEVFIDSVLDLVDVETLSETLLRQVEDTKERGVPITGPRAIELRVRVYDPEMVRALDVVMTGVNRVTVIPLPLDVESRGPVAEQVRVAFNALRYERLDR